MPSRKKRIKKSIESIKESLAEHEEKLQNAIKEGKKELVGYYIKELESIKGQINHKQKILDRKK